MNEASLPSAGRKLVPVSQLQGVIDTLAAVSGTLEEISFQLADQPPLPPTSQANGIIEMCIEQALLANVTVGTESFSAAGIADAVAAELELRGEPVPVVQIRPMLPPMMLRLFNSKLSCSVKTPGGRYARGYRGLAAR